MKKSYFASFLLTLFFGPLGLFYSSTAAALAFVLIDIAVGLITYSIGLIFLWPVHILVGIATVGSYNSKIELEAARHSELIMSLRGVGQQPQALPENTAPRKKPGGDANFYIWGFIVLAAIIFIFKKVPRASRSLHCPLNLLLRKKQPQPWHHIHLRRRPSLQLMHLVRALTAPKQYRQQSF